MLDCVCMKAGCTEVATNRVVLTDADGSEEWRCCLRHREEFFEWYVALCTAEGADWASLLVE